MEDKSVKEKTEMEAVKPKNKKWQKIKTFVREHTDGAISILVAGIGFVGTVIGVAGIIIDHKMNKKESQYEHGWIYDPQSQMDFYVGDMTNAEKMEVNEREMNGESRIDILRDMGKI